MANYPNSRESEQKGRMVESYQEGSQEGINATSGSRGERSPREALWRVNPEQSEVQWRKGS